MRISVFSGFTGKANQVIKITTKRRQGSDTMKRTGFIRDILATAMLCASCYMVIVSLLAM